MFALVRLDTQEMDNNAKVCLSRPPAFKEILELTNLPLLAVSLSFCKQLTHPSIDSLLISSLSVSAIYWPIKFDIFS